MEGWVMREQDTPARPRRRLTEELAHREEQRRAARGIAPATVTPPTLHERGNAIVPSVWDAADWIYPSVRMNRGYPSTVISVCNCDRVEGNHDGRECNGLVEVPAPPTIQPGDLLYAVIDAGATLTIITPEGERNVYPIHVAPIENARYLWVNSWGNSWGEPVGDFDYFGNDPAQWPHGEDGGTPMTLEELLGADEKMDEIDRLLDE